VNTVENSSNTQIANSPSLSSEKINRELVKEGGAEGNEKATSSVGKGDTVNISQEAIELSNSEVSIASYTGGDGVEPPKTEN